MKIDKIKDAFERLSEKDAQYVCDIINVMSDGLKIEDIKLPIISEDFCKPLVKNELGFDEDFIEPENPTLTFSNEDILFSDGATLSCLSTHSLSSIFSLFSSANGINSTS